MIWAVLCKVVIGLILLFGVYKANGKNIQTNEKNRQAKTQKKQAKTQREELKKTCANTGDLITSMFKLASTGFNYKKAVVNYNTYNTNLDLEADEMFSVMCGIYALNFKLRIFLLIIGVLNANKDKINKDINYVEILFPLLKNELPNDYNKIYNAINSEKINVIMDKWKKNFGTYGFPLKSAKMAIEDKTQNHPLLFYPDDNNLNVDNMFKVITVSTKDILNKTVDIAGTRFINPNHFEEKVNIYIRPDNDEDVISFTMDILKDMGTNFSGWLGE